MSKRRVKGGVLAFVGFILSPLTWWNDFVINIPLAYIFALPFALLSRDLFLPAMILGYWITNVLGFLFMHYGTQAAMGKKEKYTKKSMLRDVLVSVVYTLIVIVLVLTGIVRFPTEYF